jgi:hypothetical protein
VLGRDIGQLPVNRSKASATRGRSCRLSRTPPASVLCTREGAESFRTTGKAQPGGDLQGLIGIGRGRPSPPPAGPRPKRRAKAWGMARKPAGACSRMRGDFIASGEVRPLKLRIVRLGDEARNPGCRPGSPHRIPGKVKHRHSQVIPDIVLLFQAGADADGQGLTAGRAGHFAKISQHFPGRLGVPGRTPARSSTAPRPPPGCGTGCPSPGYISGKSKISPRSMGLPGLMILERDPSWIRSARSTGRDGRLKP